MFINYVKNWNIRVGEVIKMVLFFWNEVFKYVY